MYKKKTNRKGRKITQSGNVLVYAAIILPILLGATGLVLDYGRGGLDQD